MSLEPVSQQLLDLVDGPQLSSPGLLSLSLFVLDCLAFGKDLDASAAFRLLLLKITSIVIIDYRFAVANHHITDLDILELLLARRLF